ncbi:MAG: hypothetical protein ABIH23_04875, partial [bacterium]
SAEMDMMRAKITNSFDMIKNSNQATANDIVRAEKAKADQLNRINEMQFGKQTSLLKKFKDNWLMVSAAVAGAMYSISRAWDFAKMGARADQERRSFENMAASYGQSADHIVAKLKAASGQTIDTMTLINKAGTAMMMGIDPEKLDKLMQIARATSRMTGQTVTKAFEDISLAVGRQSKMILDNLGIIVRVEDANKVYAQSLHKTSTQLTDAEKKQAFLNATIQAGEDIIRRLGDQQISAAEKVQQLESRVKDIGVSIATWLIPNLEAWAGWIQRIDEYWSGVFGGKEDPVLAYMKKQREEIQAQIEVYKELAKGGAEATAAAFSVLAPGGVDVPDLENINSLLSMLEKRLQLLDKTIEGHQKEGQAAGDAGKANVVAAEQAANAWSNLIEVLKDGEQKAVDMFKQLYDLTGMQHYADKAIEIHNQMLDNQEAEWRKYVYHEDDIRLMRESEEEKFRIKLLGQTKDFVEQERDIESERLNTTRDIANERVRIEEDAARKIVQLGDVTHTVTTFTPKTEQWMTTYQGGKAVRVINPAWQQWQDEIKGEEERNQARATTSVGSLLYSQATTNTLSDINYDMERQQQQAQQFYAQIADFMARMEQRAWGLEDWRAQYERLMGEAVSTDRNQEAWFENTLEVFNNILDSIQEIDVLERQSLEAQRQIVEAYKAGTSSIGDFLGNLGTGGMAPAQSVESMTRQYSQLLQSAQSSPENISQFLSYVQSQFMPFMKAYSGGGDQYQGVYDLTVETMKALQDLFVTHQIQLFPEDFISITGLLEVDARDILDVHEAEIEGRLAQIGQAMQGVGRDASVASPFVTELGQTVGYTGSEASTVSPSMTALAQQVLAAGGSADLVSPYFQALTGTVDTTGQSALDAANQAGLLSGTLLGTTSPMSAAASNLDIMSQAVRTKLAEVSANFQGLVANMLASVQTPSAPPTYTPAEATPATPIQQLNPHTFPYVWVPPQLKWHPWGPEITCSAYWITQAPGYGPIWMPSSYGDSSPPGPAPEPIVLYMQKGGLTHGPTVVAGEHGSEWIVPTYDPERSQFLKNVGADPDRVADAIAKRLGPMLSNLRDGGSGGDLRIDLNGRTLGRIMAREIGRNSELIRAIQRVAN